MKCLIVKVKDRKKTPTYKKMISGKDVYSFPSNLDDAMSKDGVGKQLDNIEGACAALRDWIK